ncbi:hypothetical protein cand_007130 [Cryptosporidium andersoni]|uniref:Uncharacterized protein n=1 Tax=Cryptosporidium andersoni TaxID=117008 RepID=A0A1J4MSX0_9CRYT|nr:hypothetical protein cand_007130 [Cryptosporidium andersoni]
MMVANELLNVTFDEVRLREFPIIGTESIVIRGENTPTTDTDNEADTFSGNSLTSVSNEGKNIKDLKQDIDLINSEKYCINNHNVGYSNNLDVYVNSFKQITKDNKLIRCDRIILLDLDNTLIPTSWIMQKWRNIQYEFGNIGDNFESNNNEQCLYMLTESIRTQLEEVGLFDILERLFNDLWNNGKVLKIVIVTNAGLRTVELFYLKYCLPKLNELIIKYNISIRSTEEYIKKSGPPPSPFQEEDYREFYTNAKLCEFQRVLLDCWHSKQVQFDLISAGDQACEMTAACRISKFYEERINRTKLVYIHDPDDFRFWKQTPESFMNQLTETYKELLLLLDNDSETLIGTKDDSNSNSYINQHYTDEEQTLGWFSKGKYVNIAVSKPERFVLPNGNAPIYYNTEKLYYKKQI